MGIRRQAREGALQGLFMADFHGTWELDEVGFCLDHFSLEDSVRSFADMLVEGVIANKDKIDSKITWASNRWSITRMSRIDRTIIRLATFELVFCKETPVNVVINEAIEIAKRFGTEDSPTFINGVLDKIASKEGDSVQKSTEDGAEAA